MILDEILEPVFVALSAKVIVKSQQLGDAQKVNLPHHQTRMQTSGRLIELYSRQMKDKENEEEIADLLAEIFKLSRTDAATRAREGIRSNQFSIVGAIPHQATACLPKK